MVRGLVVPYVWILVDCGQDVENLPSGTLHIRTITSHTCRLVTLTSSSNASIAMSAEMAPPGLPNIVKKLQGESIVNTRSSSAVKLQ